MHLISRSIQQSVVIDDDIHVTILEIKEDRVILEIHSPSAQVPYRIETLYIQSNEVTRIDSESTNATEETPELVGARS
ncbi:carbon storage regulator [Polystyrenella longa]|uniref:Carbon storage regulator n=1 Tax=Polystyrenella longa TaxID=2528007 RepID=A0A518CS07_9PLAN|nr:carbon storage regulator [Polystyrenella longa]QDU81998.1 carbon storage regulator [Polystyrenella longa]